jgi:hypothetical protein
MCRRRADGMCVAVADRMEFKPSRLPPIARALILTTALFGFLALLGLLIFR